MKTETKVTGSKIKEIKIEEAELEGLLANSPSIIEEGIVVLSRQTGTDSGPLDILAVDGDGALTIIELKNEINDQQLDQGLRYYDWARSNLQWISRSFPRVDADQEPRLILIAPTFSENLRRVAKYVKVTLDLIEYHAIQLQNGEKDVLCRLVDITMPPEPTVIPSVENNLKHIEDESIRQLCSDCIGGLKNMGFDVRPLKWYWFSVWHKGSRFMYLGCKKKFFVYQVQRSDGSWSGRTRISTKEDWTKALVNEIEPAYKSI